MDSRKEFSVKVIKEYVLPLSFVFVITVLLCIVSLVVTALIPKEAIAENCKKSGEYFYERDLFPYLIKEQFNTRQDNYADTILVNIMYHIDETNVIPSLVEASYYQKEGENVHHSFYRALQEEKIPNIEYFRYWHGAMVLLRPLFLFTDISGVRGILGIVLLMLTFAVSVSLHRKKETALGVCYLLSNLLLQSWICFFCIEYITTFLIMNIAALGVIDCYHKYQQSRQVLNQKIAGLMCICGITACFFDFLTTETLTVTIPLFLLLVFLYRNHQLKDIRKEVCFLAIQGGIWGISYGFMFLLKWGIAAVFLGKEAFGKAMESAAVRMVGTVTLGNTNLDETATSWQRFLGALARNQGALFPFQGEMKLGAAVAAFWGLCFLFFGIIYLFRSKNISYKMIGLSLLLCLVPYLRYIVLANHAYLHYFFTYRAQLIVLLAGLFCCWEFGIKNIRKLR